MTFPYQGRITRESGTGTGASVLNVTSGGSVTLQAGARLSTSATIQLGSTACLIMGDQGSTVLKPAATTLNNPVVVLQIGRNQMWYMASSSGSPIFSASPGDLLWHAQSASTALYLNRSNGTGGSFWIAVRETTGSQLPGAI